MQSFRTLTFLAVVVITVIFTVSVAAPPSPNGGRHGNSYFSYTKALPPDASGVVEIPARFRWGVETGSSGFDVAGNRLPDSRIMLRLYDPEPPFTTSFIAQMDMATAARLHHELGSIIIKKLQNPDLHHHPVYWDPEKIPTGRFRGIDDEGKAIIELEYPPTNGRK